jgi:hypothetical protein
MSELHWTGAAVLLSLAVLGGGSTQPRRDRIMSWAEFARQHGLAADEPTVEAGAQGGPDPSTSPLLPRQAPSAPHHWAATLTQPRSTRLRADATCGHCGRAAGDLEWDAATSWKPAVLRPTGGAPAQLVPSGARLRCAHCGGPVFAEEPEPIVERPPVELAPSRRGRPRKSPLRAS